MTVKIASSSYDIPSHLSAALVLCNGPAIHSKYWDVAIIEGAPQRLVSVRTKTYYCYYYHTTEYLLLPIS